MAGNTLGGIPLPHGAIWTAETEIGATDITTTVKFALDATPNIWETHKSGHPIDIAGGVDFGWITRADLMALKALNVPGAIVVLVYNGIQRNVRFRNEDGMPISALPCHDYDEYTDTDWYHSLMIQLMEM